MKTFFTITIILTFVTLGFSQSSSQSTRQSNERNIGQSIDALQLSVNKAYPNPVKDVVTIELQSQNSGNIQMSLFNILGTEVKKWEPYLIQSGEQKIKLDLSFLKSGIYFLKISKSDQTVTQVLKKV